MIMIWVLRLVYQMTRKVDKNDLNSQSIMILKWLQAQHDLQQKWNFFHSH